MTKAMIASRTLPSADDVFEGSLYSNFTKTYMFGSVREDDSLLKLKPKSKPVVKETSAEELREEWFAHVVSEFEVLSHIDEDDWFIKDFLGVQ